MKNATTPTVPVVEPKEDQMPSADQVPEVPTPPAPRDPSMDTLLDGFTGRVEQLEGVKAVRAHSPPLAGTDPDGQVPVLLSGSVVQEMAPKVSPPAEASRPPRVQDPTALRMTRFADPRASWTPRVLAVIAILAVAVGVGQWLGHSETPLPRADPVPVRAVTPAVAPPVVSTAAPVAASGTSAAAGATSEPAVVPATSGSRIRPTVSSSPPLRPPAATAAPSTPSSKLPSFDEKH